MHWGCCCPPGATTNYKAATFRAGQKVCAAMNRSRIRFSAFWDKLRVKTWFEYVRLSGVFITSSCSRAICASLRGCGFCLPWRRFSVQFLPHIGFSHLGHSAEKPFKLRALNSLGSTKPKFHSMSVIQWINAFVSAQDKHTACSQKDLSWNWTFQQNHILLIVALFYLNKIPK